MDGNESDANGVGDEGIAIHELKEGMAEQKERNSKFENRGVIADLLQTAADSNEEGVEDEEDQYMILKLDDDTIEKIAERTAEVLMEKIKGSQ
ncbi:MAG TPA: hypothetical protein DHN29_06025 [Cytophagales bacterium]|nr:hypothetical protein [Cytophagales bacterium]|tara:strand:+ start:487 stop:765 length:279 start_codon:yes stop_codon:yes gene_type:complete